MKVICDSVNDSCSKNGAMKCEDNIIKICYEEKWEEEQNCLDNNKVCLQDCIEEDIPCCE